VCSSRGLLTGLAWACCSRGIRHAWCGLVVVFTHALRGIVVLAVSVSSQSLTRLVWARCSRGILHAWHGLIAVFSHALRGFVVLLRGGGRSAGLQVERGRSVERDNIPFRSNAR